MYDGPGDGWDREGFRSIWWFFVGVGMSHVAPGSGREMRSGRGSELPLVDSIVEAVVSFPRHVPLPWRWLIDDPVVVVAVVCV